MVAANLEVLPESNLLKNFTEDLPLKPQNSNFQISRNTERNNSTTSHKKESVEQAKNDFFEPILQK